MVQMDRSVGIVSEKFPYQDEDVAKVLEALCVDPKFLAVPFRLVDAATVEMGRSACKLSRVDAIEAGRARCSHRLRNFKTLCAHLLSG